MSELSINHFIQQLRHNEVSLWLDEGKLRCKGPENVLKGEFAQLIKQRKKEIEEFLLHNENENHLNYLKRPVGQNTEYALSPAQQRLWFVQQLDENSNAYNMSFSFLLEGVVNVDALRKSISAIIERHHILRSIYAVDDEGKPKQRVLSFESLDLETVFTVQYSQAEKKEQLIKEIAQIHSSRQFFELDKDIPIRIKYLNCLNDKLHALQISIHHIAADGFSLNIFINELSHYYLQAVTGISQDLPSLPCQYGDYAELQNKQNDSLTKIKFWDDVAVSGLPITQLTGDYSQSSSKQGQAGFEKFLISSEINEKITHLCKSYHLTKFDFLLTVFFILISRYTHQKDLVIGTALTGRNTPELEPLIGLFVNPLPIYTTIDGELDFLKNAKKIQKTLQLSYENAIPFDHLVKQLQQHRELNSHPLFQIKFQFEHALGEPVKLPGFSIERLALNNRTTTTDLSLDISESPLGLNAAFEYNTDLYKATTIKQLIEHFQSLIENIISNIHLDVDSLDFLSEQEKNKQLIDWNNTENQFNQLHWHQRVEKIAKENPDNIALIYDDLTSCEKISYKQLNEQANQLAREIEKNINSDAYSHAIENIVAICIPRSIDMIVALLACFKVGTAFLPIDTKSPLERIKYMLNDAKADLILSLSHQQLPEDKTFNRINLDSHKYDHHSRDNLNLEISSRNLAYIIYTSGSTGKPKGVLIEHAGLNNLIDDKIRQCLVNKDDCVLQFFSFSFDASVPEWSMSLAAGASLLLSSADCMLPGENLQCLLLKHSVSHITMTPSALQSLPSDDYPDLKMVLVGGEPPSPELIELWGKNRRFINAYGPTETTVNASMVECSQTKIANLKTPANKQLLILNDQLQLLPVGVVGELHVSGVGLARAYLNRPVLTAEKFIPNPYSSSKANSIYSEYYQTLYKTGDLAAYNSDGSIRILGRIDTQVKIRGYRIETQEIEKTILENYTEIETAIVIAKTLDSYNKQLIAYIIPKNNTQIDLFLLKQDLRHLLPSFMVPSNFIEIERLPLTINGKLDINQLPEPKEKISELKAPRSDIELKLHTLFCDLLNKDKICINDDFFELGGHSLLATQLLTKCKEIFSVTIKVIDLFNRPNIAGLADIIDKYLNNTNVCHIENNDFLDDIKLDPTINTFTLTAFENKFTNVFLTGANGFIGVFLLRAMLEATNATVYCLVRERNYDLAFSKLRDAMQYYGAWQESFIAKIRIVVGDLSKDKLGINSDEYDQLAQSIDAIIHNGAKVHHLSPYSQLKKTNVNATEELIRLAATHKLKAIHYCSSLSVLPSVPNNGKDAIYESDLLYDYPAPQGGYNQSKWVAEQLVYQAGQRGIPITIHRPGAISGYTVNGAYNSQDILSRIMEGCIATNMAPEYIPNLYLLPIDYLADLMVSIFIDPSAIGKTFNHRHSKAISADNLFEACENAGYSVQRVNPQTWQQKLDDIAKNQVDHPLYSLILLLGNQQASSNKQTNNSSPYDIEQSMLYRNKLVREEPLIDESLLSIYLEAMLTRSSYLNKLNIKSIALTEKV